MILNDSKTSPSHGPSQDDKSDLWSLFLFPIQSSSQRKGCFSYFQTTPSRRRQSKTGPSHHVPGSLPGPFAPLPSTLPTPLPPLPTWSLPIHFPRPPLGLVRSLRLLPQHSLELSQHLLGSFSAPFPDSSNRHPWIFGVPLQSPVFPSDLALQISQPDLAECSGRLT